MTYELLTGGSHQKIGVSTPRKQQSVCSPRCCHLQQHNGSPTFLFSSCLVETCDKNQISNQFPKMFHIFFNQTRINWIPNMLENRFPNRRRNWTEPPRRWRAPRPPWPTGRSVLPGFFQQKTSPFCYWKKGRKKKKTGWNFRFLKLQILNFGFGWSPV